MQKMSAIGQLTGGVAHDFNNLLSGITGYAKLLKSSPKADDRLKIYAQKISDLTERAAGLTRKLVAFARKEQPVIETVHIHKSIGSVIDMLERTIDNRIRIKRKFNAVPDTIKGDAGQLDNAILNLALNAKDAMPEGGDMIFATEIAALDQEYCRLQTRKCAPRRYLLFSISDTGIGMDKETRARIFEPFFTTKKAGHGTGLGLESVYRCVKQHNGCINFSSEPGRGSVFNVYLPLATDGE